MIPAKLDKLAEMHNREWNKGVVEEGKAACQGCEVVKSKDDLSRCKGCSEVWYCNKVSFFMNSDIGSQPDCG